MPVYIALIRAINVGGHRKIKMTDLCVMVMARLINPDSKNINEFISFSNTGRKNVKKVKLTKNKH